MDYTLTPYNLIMEKPGRQELQKMYEELADEILMEIVQNIDQEYEKAAVEAAGIVLDKRGVDVPCPVEATVESLKWFGERLPGPLIEIPGFAADEVLGQGAVEGHAGVERDVVDAALKAPAR